MFASTVLFSALASMVLVNGAPVARDAATPPPGWAYGYLEKYDTYHTRYLALDCHEKHDTEFFDQCCHPMLATETLEKNRPPQCIPDATASSSAAEVVATETAAASDDDSDAAFAAATSTVEPTPSASPSPAAPAEDNSNDNQDNGDNNDDQDSGSSSGGSGEMTGGFATFFYQNGNPGACGNYHSDSDMLVAIDTNGWWQNTGSQSPYCGQWVEITNTNNGRTVRAQIQDACPTCVSDNSLDLSVGAFNAIASESEGSVPITWHFA